MNLLKKVYLANLYIKELKNTDLILPYQNEVNKHVYHLFTIYHPKKKKEIFKLMKKKI